MTLEQFCSALSWDGVKQVPNAAAQEAKIKDATSVEASTGAFPLGASPYDPAAPSRLTPWIDPADCSCSGDEPCNRCGAHIGCKCHIAPFPYSCECSEEE